MAETLLNNTSVSSGDLLGDSMAAANNNYTATQGFCGRIENCSLVAAFAIIIGLAILLNYSRTVPLFFISIR